MKEYFSSALKRERRNLQYTIVYLFSLRDDYAGNLTGELDILGSIFRAMFSSLDRMIAHLEPWEYTNRVDNVDFE
ncbi:hypothetical protein JTE90_010601 [Oedothorax gibbosus]|uniref:Uncharacterized protein n=1 Tax=Oedothorax gibbosus TaxID=931172 RepID=A0AAV6TS31_9ARAC|nr:hypothetical protein JTE90_010601 [Oedothorax gibbosus]